ncbi:hypothetical protein HOE04_05415 [archaeon]|jgi:hypothetical protein|nr:hypothetical protein [archaeon]
MTKKIIPFDERLVDIIKKEFGDEATPEFLNMLQLGKAAYEHGYHNLLTKEKVQEWAGEMYEAGQKQRQISEGKIHSCITINSYDMINAGAHLSLFGKRQGLLTE